MKNLTELVFILDRSGSMSGLESDTIGGFNSMLDKQKKETGDALVTSVLFDHDYELLHDRVNIKKVEDMTEKLLDTVVFLKEGAVELFCDAEELRQERQMSVEGIYKEIFGND